MTYIWSAEEEQKYVGSLTSANQTVDVDYSVNLVVLCPSSGERLLPEYSRHLGS